MSYEPVIGLEVHVQLDTATKIFCGCANVFGCRENQNVCPVCLGLPGTLPVLNAQVLKSAVRVALAFHCEVRNFIKFDRKHYYYPDLPKNFQISQYDMPLSENGFLEIETPQGPRKIRIKRIHIEEDAGKLIHPDDRTDTLVDYNRTGTPLLEIVSEPDLFSAEEAYQYLSALKLHLQYLKVSDCDMEKGSLRCDANISLRPKGQQNLGVKAELKNMNSFKAVRAALDHEISRQTKILSSGGFIVQETRLWDEKNCLTHAMRSKEEAHDYRYFPEPDLPPIVITQKQIDEAAASLPEMPQARLDRFVKKLGLLSKDAGVLISDQGLADYFEKCLSHFSQAKKIVNWLIGPVLFQMNSKNCRIQDLGLEPAALMKLIQRVEDGTISNLVGKDILGIMINEGREVDEIISSGKLAQVSGGEVLEKTIEEVLSANEKSVNDYLSGKESALMFLVGQVMRSSKGKANPKAAREALIKRLTR